jgi:hypothetical protein
VQRRWPLSDIRFGKGFGHHPPISGLEGGAMGFCTAFLRQMDSS